MTKSARASGVAFGLLVLMMGSRSIAADAPAVEARAAFDRLKALAGDWTVARPEAGGGHGAGHESKIAYKVTANGSALMETFSGGECPEMISVYHLDGDDLRLTHYCAIGNQPRMKLDRRQSTPDNLVFVFDGGTNLDPAKDMHVHSGRITFLEGGRLEAEWVAYQDGKQAMASKFAMSRP
jgi:hypothetical protein